MCKKPKIMCLFNNFFSSVSVHISIATQLHCCLCRIRKLLDFFKNILICVTKMKKGLMGLEQNEGE